MLKLDSVTFKDDVTGKTIEVHLPDRHVTSKEGFSPDEYVLCSFHAGLLLAGGISKVQEFLKQQ